jgi:hypothetical protein
MDMGHRLPEGSADRISLLNGPHSIDDDHRVLGQPSQEESQSRRDPLSSSGSIKALPGLLQRASFQLRSKQGADQLTRLETFKAEAPDQVRPKSRLA